MKYIRSWIIISSCLVVSMIMVSNGDPLVPALCIFGDSVMDVGNNNYLPTLLRANFLPYGRDFVTHKPSGRFCNGKLAADYTDAKGENVKIFASVDQNSSTVRIEIYRIHSEYLGFDTYPPPYLSPAKSTLLLTGANFASAGSGYNVRTAQLYAADILQKAISLTRQVKYYQDWQKRVVKMVGNERASAIFSGGIHILSAGSSDFLQNYYIRPVLRSIYTPSKFSDILLTSYYTFVQDLYGLGVRRIGVTTLPPAGCLPAAITLFGPRSNACIARLNRDAVMFNNKLNETSQNLLAQFPDLKLVVLDVYQPLLDMITKPSDNGFFESRRGCCGTGILETSLLCNAKSIGTCSNASNYVFWDGFHPSEAANQILAENLLEQGQALIS